MGFRWATFRTLAQTRSWWRAAMRRDRLESDMESELAHHIACMTSDLVRAGYSPTEAARRARIALGSPMVQKEGMRTSLGLRWWDELRNDARYGMRLLRKSPGFTAIAASSLALAIGANTTIFSIAKQMLYDQLNVPHPEQLRLFRWAGDKQVAVRHLWGDWNKNPSGVTSTSFSYPAFEQLRRDNRRLGDVFAFKGVGRVNATIDGEAQVLQSEMVSGNYFAELEVQPMLGRAIQPSDDRDGAPPVVLLSGPFWQRTFGSSPNVLGRTIRVNMTPVTIIGVTPRGFTGAKSVQSAPDLFLPLSLQPVVVPRFGGSFIHDANPGFWWLNIMARVQAGVPDSQAQAPLDVSLAAATRASHPEDSATMPRLQLSDGSRGLFYTKATFAKPIYVLLSVVGFVLLLACANIASLLLARSAARQREISVRLALGAGRNRIIRQVLSECLLLSVIGGVAGLMLAFAGRNLIPRLLENPWEESHDQLNFDWRVFAFTAIVTLSAGFLFGMAPALASIRNEFSSSLKEAAQTTTRRRRGFGGKAIVGFQLMLSAILVVGAVLFARTLFNLSRINPGFDVNHLLLFSIEQPESRYPAPSDILLHQQILDKLGALPGVDAATVAEVPYLSNNEEIVDFLPEGQAQDQNKEQSAYNNVVGQNFFQTLGIPILAGRGFNERDTRSSTKVAVITHKLAERSFPGLNPVGRHFRTHMVPVAGKTGEGDLVEIVGICADTHYSSLREDPPGIFYLPYMQAENLSGGLTYEIRTAQRPETLAPAFRHAVQSIDPDLPLQDLRTQIEQIDALMQQERIFAALTTGFAVLALLLACVGVYGTMAYSVAQRTNEIGIRLAMGAKPRQVLAMVLREASWLSGIGIFAGLGSALLLTRVVKSMLYGLQPTDPTSVAGGAVLLALVALAASWIPAQRAAGVEPMQALRHE